MIAVFILFSSLMTIYAGRCIYKTLAVFLPLSRLKKVAVSAAILLLAFVFIYAFGSLAAGILINLFILFTLTDLMLLILKLPVINKFNPANSDGFGKIYAAFLLLMTCIVSFCGYSAATDIHTTYYTKTVADKSFNNTRIMFISDIHANERNYQRIADHVKRTAQSENPDVIIIGGDLADNMTDKKHLEHFTKLFSQLSESCELLYVYGNHDIMTSPSLDTAYITSSLENAGVTVLCDESISINGITYIGRNEWFAQRQGTPRKDISILMPEDKNVATVVIDHQPKELERLRECGVDISFSGHTHNGQVFPMGTLSDKLGINEMQYGKKDMGTYTAIVSSGAGTWAMDMRTQGICEIVIADIKH